MALNAVGPTDDQHRRIQYLKRPLHLRRKVHMARGIEKGHFPVPQGQPCLFGEDCDSSGSLQLIVIEKGIAVVDPADFSDAAPKIENALRQRCLSRIHMGKNAQCQFFFIFHKISFNLVFLLPVRFCRSGSNQILFYHLPAPFTRKKCA